MTGWLAAALATGWALFVTSVVLIFIGAQNRR